MKEIPQTVPCPICKTAVPFTVQGLLRGERFVCPNCSAAISLSQESMPRVQTAMRRLDDMQAHKPVEGQLEDKNAK